MKEFATRLMLHGQSQQSMLPAAIFGTAGSIGQALNARALPVRIGLWPIQSQSEPQVAMGLLVVLGYLLERYRMIRVYPLLARVDGAPETYNWQIELSQFEVEDWQLDDLDDNVGLWGKLTRVDEAIKFEVTVENDLETTTKEDETYSFSYEADNLTSLLGLLPQIAADIAASLDADDLDILSPAPVFNDMSENDLNGALEQVFQLELQLYLSLWGKEWPEAEVIKQIDGLLTDTLPLNEFGAWLAAQVVARLIVYIDLDFVPIVRQILSVSTNSSTAVVILSRALFDKPHTVAQAIELLRNAIANQRGDANIYLALSEMYRSTGRVTEMVDAFQDAIDSGYSDIPLLQQYASVMTALNYNNHEIDTFVMVDPDEYVEDTLLWEAIETYEAILEQAPDSVEAQSRQLQQLLEVEQGGERLWSAFRRLVQVDTTGEQVRAIVDGLYVVEDLTPAIHILQAAADEAADNVDRQLNLAAAYIMDEQTDAAKTILNSARTLTDKADVLEDIEHLELMADDPEFEMHLGEITDILDAGNSIDSDEVEFLENILEKVPTFAEAYLLLAQAYSHWDEQSTAIETLLDGHRLLPDNPDIIVQLSEQLWETGEEELALKYLGVGLSKNPNYVSLLALTGLYLFEDGQAENARAYLQRAESLAPRHPMLARVRQQIAQSVND